jgi:hypothetical protein
LQGRSFALFIDRARRSESVRGSRFATVLGFTTTQTSEP